MIVRRRRPEPPEPTIKDYLTMGMDIERIKRMVSLVEQNQLSELTIEEEGLSITIKAKTGEKPAAVGMPVAQAGTHVEIQAVEAPEIEVEPEEAETPAVEESEHLVRITSPMIGVFYRCPSPDSPPFVNVGDIIEEGQTVGLIEAMKVFSEVPSEVAGRVVDMPVENAKLVQQDDVLVVIDTSQTE